ISVEDIKTSLKSLGEQCASLGNQLKSSSGSEFVEVQEYLTDHCQIELEEANKSLEEFLEVQNNLAVFFCENQSSFKIEECLKIFKILIVRLRQALQENEEQEERRHRMKAAALHNDKESAVPKSEDQQENVFFVTLEKGQNLHRRRVKNEVVGDREVVRSPRVRRLKENSVNNADNHDNDGQRELVSQNGQVVSPSAPQKRPVSNVPPTRVPADTSTAQKSGTAGVSSTRLPLQHSAQPRAASQ
ncbi:hypothetical protein ANCDUO_18136, partial [Ancylostoma duodenale]